MKYLTVRFEGTDDEQPGFWLLSSLQIPMPFAHDEHKLRELSLQWRDAAEKAMRDGLTSTVNDLTFHAKQSKL